MSVDRFVSKFCAWLDKYEFPAPSRRRFPGAMRQCLGLLQSADASCDVVVRPLSESAEIDVSYTSDVCWVYPSTRNLVVGVSSPSWRGLRASTDEHINDILSDFFHFATQYVARSHALRITGGIALTRQLACDFRFEGVLRLAVGPDAPIRSVQEARDYVAHSTKEREPPDYRLDPARFARSRRNDREFTTWVEALNTLDPHLHRAVFQFWRASALASAQFWEEAITSLDGVVDVGAQALRSWMSLAETPVREESARLLGMSGDDQNELKMLYELRCDFGAHPAATKWWDFAEVYEEELDHFFDAVRRYLLAIARMEHRFRTVDAHPQRWSTWFLDNATMLFDAVWFARIR